jgi:oxygen-independent coproporphyrinogen-3 oxidase
MGLQSTSQEILARVNRKTQLDRGSRAIENLRRAGFRRLNVDLIFALPGQTQRHWREDLDYVAALPVDSVTTYDCLYRGKGRALTRGTDKPGPEVYGVRYDQAYEVLTRYGFHALYGSVNFSRHPGETGTSPYFEGRLLEGLPYVGVGNYASSLVGDTWWFAPYRVNDWLREVEKGVSIPAGDVYRLPCDELMAKYVLLSLSFGILDPRRFRRCFGVDLDTIYAPVLEFALEQRWLCRQSDGYRIAPRAFVFMPKVRALFYSTAAITWLQDRALQRFALS